MPPLQSANVNHELALNEFLSKECQFYVGLHYLRMAAHLRRPPNLRERLTAHELLPCGVTVVLDADSAHRDPHAMHQVRRRGLLRGVRSLDAGGIACRATRNLVCSGFSDILHGLKQVRFPWLGP